MEQSPRLAAFRDLHQRVSRSQATPAELEAHHRQWVEVARAMTSAQGLTEPEGQSPRRDFRIAHRFELELDHQQRAVTHDISQSGFSAVVTGTFARGQQVAFAVTLERGGDPLRGNARVVSSVPRADGQEARVSFAFLPLGAAGAEHLERALLDAALPRLA